MTPTQRQFHAALMAVLVASACSTAPRETPQPLSNAQGPEAAVARARADSIRHPYTAADIFFMTPHDRPPRAGDRDGGVGRFPRGQPVGAHPGGPDHQCPARRDRLHAAVAPESPAAGARGTNGMGMAMPMSGAATDTLMPGMLTDAQMHQLDQARGADFDRLFLTFMLQHHRGAVVMVQDAVRHLWRRAGRDRVQARVRHQRRSDHRDRPHGAHAGHPADRRVPVMFTPSSIRNFHSVPTEETAMVFASPPLRTMVLAAGVWIVAACASSKASSMASPTALTPALDMSTNAPNPDPRVGLKAGVTNAGRSRLEPARALPDAGRRRSSRGSPTPTWPSSATTSFRAATTATRSGTSPTPSQPVLKTGVLLPGVAERRVGLQEPALRLG